MKECCQQFFTMFLYPDNMNKFHNNTDDGYYHSVAGQKHWCRAQRKMTIHKYYLYARKVSKIILPDISTQSCFLYFKIMSNIMARNFQNLFYVGSKN